MCLLHARYFYPCWDDLFFTFTERFGSNSIILSSISCLLPSKVYNSTFNDIQPAYDMHKDDLKNYTYTCILKTELWQAKWTKATDPNKLLDALPNCREDIFPNTKTLLKIYSILPVTTASAELSFSSLKCINTY